MTTDADRSAATRRVLLGWARRYAGLAVVVAAFIVLVIVAPTVAR